MDQLGTGSLTLVASLLPFYAVREIRDSEHTPFCGQNQFIFLKKYFLAIIIYPTRVKIPKIFSDIFFRWDTFYIVLS